MVKAQLASTLLLNLLTGTCAVEQTGVTTDPLLAEPSLESVFQGRDGSSNIVATDVDVSTSILPLDDQPIRFHTSGSFTKTTTTSKPLAP